MILVAVGLADSGDAGLDGDPKVFRTDLEGPGQFLAIDRIRPQPVDRVRAELPIDGSRISAIGNRYGSYTVLSLLVTTPPGTFAAAAFTAR